MQREAAMSAIQPKTDSVRNGNGGDCGGCSDKQVGPEEVARAGAEMSGGMAPSDFQRLTEDSSALWFIVGILIVLILLKK